MNISNIFENHESDLVLAHLKAQDDLYANGYNDDPKHTKKMSLVPLLDNADMARAKFDGVNQVKFYHLIKSDSSLEAYMEGFKWGLSKLHSCEPGYAIGYYSYVTTERIELFFDVDEVFALDFKCFSKKLWSHDMYLNLYYHYNSLGYHGSDIEVQVYEEKHSDWGDSEEYPVALLSTVRDLLK